MQTDADPFRRPPMRIAWFVHPLRLGGVEHFLLRLAQELDPERIQVVVVFHARGPVVDAFSHAGLEVQTGGNESFEHGFAELVERLGSLELDAVQTNLYSPLAAVAAGTLGLPHLWRVGGHPDIALRRLPLDERKAQVELMALQSRGIVCNSEYVRNAFRGVAGPAPALIRNGMPPLQPALAATEPTDPSGTICMIGHFDPQKRHEDLIRAAPRVLRAFPDTCFSLFGSTFDEPTLQAYRDDLDDLIRSLDLQSRMVLGPTNQPDTELRRSSVSVLPSVGESSSNAILESFAAGTPVVAADSAGNAEMIEPGVTGLLVPPREPEALAEAILAILADPDLARRLAEGGRRRLHAVYGIEACARAYEAFYRQHLDGDRETVSG